MAALARPHPGPTVAVTHHPPIAEAADRFRDAPGVPWWVPAFYATTLLTDLPSADRPALWISGHFHAAHDLALHGTRCLANPSRAAPSIRAGGGGSGLRPGQVGLSGRVGSRRPIITRLGGGCGS